MQTFKQGNTYRGRFITDADSFVVADVVGRTAKFVKVIVSGDKVESKKIYVRDNVEFFFPFGQYSMSPVIKADSAL